MVSQTEALLTTALGLQPSWHVAKDELMANKRRIEVEHTDRRAACSECGAEHQLFHYSVRPLQQDDATAAAAWSHSNDGPLR